jgi:hypothetical protein
MCCFVTRRDVSAAAHAECTIEYKWQDISCVTSTRRVLQETDRHTALPERWSARGWLSHILHGRGPGRAGESRGRGVHESCTSFLLVNRLDSFGSDVALNGNILTVPPADD